MTTLCSLYFPLFIFSTFDYFQPSNTTRKTLKRMKEEDNPQMIEAIKSGYEQVIYPGTIAQQIKNLKFY